MNKYSSYLRVARVFFFALFLKTRNMKQGVLELEFVCFVLVNLCLS